MPLHPPPLDFLLSASLMSLGDFEISALARAAKIRKTLRPAIEEWVKQEADALFARWLIEHRQELMELGRTDALQKTLDFVGSSGVETGAVFGSAKRV